MDLYDYELKKIIAFRPTKGVIDPECITFLKGVILHEGRDSWEIEDYLMAQGYGKVDVIQGL